MNKKYPTFFLTWFNKFLRVPYPGFKISVINLGKKMFPSNPLLMNLKTYNIVSIYK